LSSDNFQPDETQWPIKIVGFELVSPTQLLFSPNNVSINGQPQQLALDGVLKHVGWLAPVVVNTLTNHLIDGKARAYRAAANNQALIPVIYVNLDKELEPLAALFFMGLAKMAYFDNDLPYRLDSEGLKVITSNLSKVDELVKDILASGGIAKKVMLGLLKLGVIKVGEESRSRTTAKKVSIEFLKEVQYQCRKHGKTVYAIDLPGLSSVRVYGSKAEVEEFFAGGEASIQRKRVG
jgi:hypothetical protein